MDCSIERLQDCYETVIQYQREMLGADLSNAYEGAAGAVATVLGSKESSDAVVRHIEELLGQSDDAPNVKAEQTEQDVMRWQAMGLPPIQRVKVSKEQQ